MNVGLLGPSHGPSLPAMIRVMEIVVGRDYASPAASVTFPGIPQIGSHLRFTFGTRGDAAGNAGSTFTFRINGDAGGNYQWERHKAAAGTPSSGEGLSQTSMQISDGMPTSGATANRRLAGELLLWDYASPTWETTTRSIVSWCSDNATSDIQYDIVAGHWRSVQPVTDVTFVPGTGNFVTGSVFRMYIEF